MTPQEASDSTHRIFEDYLDLIRVRWETIAVGAKRSADYRLSVPDAEIICEVKTIAAKTRLKSGSYDPCRAIVNKLRKARGQLGRDASLPHCVVLESKSFADTLEPSVVAAAAFGPGFQSHSPNHDVIDGTPPALRFFRRSELPERNKDLANAALSPACNTRISAVVILCEYALCDRHLAVWRQLATRQAAGEIIRPGENIRVLAAHADRLPDSYRFRGTVRTIALENPHAKVPFPKTVFRGPFDQRWALQGDLYGPIWIGSTLETLHADGVPVAML